ncbi:KPN_02809 family neutral zinc metallopeptidase [Demequina lignilytica]|uniref:Neutral zinc metallopeptidase n=1 Tax=Demequina lignilytica TaxID=3051663 RepID=A0AB35MKK9_9MICO|nr:neutral zinc metallopeptidase [Demequina sp. SYSU T0a273]MDN4484379.1 neutral zinc metallopeptidase [Demequina sp. SYSU T0a273]
MTFNEGSRLDPGRVGSRGRSAKGGLAIGGGIGGLAIVLLYMFLGGNPSDLGALMGGTGSAPVDDTAQQDLADRCQTGADANDYTDCRMVGTVNSLDAYWAEALPAAGVDFAYPGIVLFDQATQSDCGTASSATGPFYCPPDQTIYLDVSFFDVLATDFGASGGPLAEMYVMAHEYGHHIENLVGVFDVADRTGTGEDSDSVKVELMADCLAGVWAGHAATVPDASGTPYLAPLTQQDLDDALSAAAAVGDDRIQEASGGEADPHTFTHGSAEQRADAFAAGYRNGTLAACDAFGVTDG